MERYVAVDNVTAWPNLTLMPDGAIIASIFNQPTHGGWEGDIECWASEDEGRTWKLRGTPAPHEPGTNRMVVAAGLGHNNELIVIASGWDKRKPAGIYSGWDVGQQLLPAWVCRSTDGGRTWERKGEVLPPGDGAERTVPFGDIVQLPADRLGVCIYSWVPPEEHSAYFYVSSDGGATWRQQGVIGKGNSNETTPVALSDGRILAAVRTLKDKNVELYVSDDQGATWTHDGPLTQSMEHPANFLVLADGRILLTYGQRAGEHVFRGVGYRLSDDGGKSWGTPKVLHKSEHDADMKWPQSDGGYPASVQMPDGTIVTAFYNSTIPRHHERYFMGVIRWHVDE